MRVDFNIAILLLMSLILSACGGGSSGGSNRTPVAVTPPNPPPEPDPPLVGQFIDSPVAGLHYETDTQSGTTNQDGEFEYMAGETVRFYFGTWMIGEIEGQPTVTPFSLYNAPGLDDIRLVQHWINNAGPNRYYGDSRPLNRAINLAFLMQTLDIDNNPENGIVLPPELGEFTDGYVPILERGPLEFQDSRAVRGMVARARESGLWADGLRVQTIPLVLKHLTEQHFPDAMMSVTTSEFGTRFYTYDANGNRTQSDNDSNGDGTPESRTTYSGFNEFGQPTLIETDGDVDGIIDTRWISTFTSYGARTRDASDSGNDGIYEYDRRASFNERGQYTEIARYDDGSLNFRLTYFYNSDGTFDYTLRDSDGDGVIDTRTTYLSEDGLIVSRAYDDGDDGTINRTRREEYNANGDRILTELDNDGDGNLDYVARQTYNDQGLITSYIIDNDGDGVTDFVRTTTYNEIFQVVEYRDDTDGDGIIDQVTSNEYSTDGFRTMFERDEDGDGVYDRRISYTLDADGNQVESANDNDGDGVLDQIYTSTFNEYGQTLRRDADTNADGNIDSQSHYEYALAPSGNWFNRAGILMFSF